MPREITSATSLDNLKLEAKRWLKALRANDARARARFKATYPSSGDKVALRDVLHALAREHGYENWASLKQALQRRVERGADSNPRLSREDHERLAQDLVSAFNSRAAEALARLNQHYQRDFTFDDLWAEIWRRVYAFRQRSSKVPQNYLQLDEAQTLIAQDAGFGSWSALMRAVTSGAPAIPPYVVDASEDAIGPRRRLSDDEWDALIGVMTERKIARLHASGLMSDHVLARIAELDHVTHLTLGGSRELSDEGLLQLRRMPQLQHLELSEYPGGKLTDRGLEVLRHLPNLRTFEMTWQRGITDAGVANLKFCDQLERVDLMGSPTGDGAIRALQGKRNLRQFKSGRLVTDASSTRPSSSATGPKSSRPVSATTSGTRSGSRRWLQRSTSSPRRRRAWWVSPRRCLPQAMR